MQNKEYADNYGISQSQIKKFKFVSPLAWKRLYLDKQTDDVKDNPSFIFGSLVDILCFTPDRLDDLFYVGEAGELPSEAVTWIINDYYQKIVRNNQFMIELSAELPEDGLLREFNLNDRDHLIDSANNYKFKDKDGNEKTGWNTGWKEQTRIDSLIKNGTNYFEALKAANGKKVISQRMNMEAIELRDILQRHPRTTNYFVPDENNTLLFQLEIFTTYKVDDVEVPIKGALDIVRFNHKDKTVQIIDFKTSYSAFDFIQSIKKYGYAEQLSFYTFLLKQWLTEYCNGEYCTYTMLPPINIVIDNRDKIPYKYSYDWQDIEIVRYGNKAYLKDLYQTENHNQKIKTGWEEILCEIAWHMKTGMWNEPRELYENDTIRVNLINS